VDSSEGALMNQPNEAPQERVRGIKDDINILQLELHWNSLYIRASLTMKGTNNLNIKLFTHLLIDSGATRNFVNSETIFKLGVPVESLERPMQVTLIDGKDSSEGSIRHFIRVKLEFDNNVEQEEIFFLTKIDANHPWILGYEWLKRRNPLIDWTQPSIQFNHGKENCRAIQLKYKRDIEMDQELNTALKEKDREEEALKGEKSGITTPTNSTETNENPINSTETSEESLKSVETPEEDSDIDVKELFKQRRALSHPLVQKGGRNNRLRKRRKWKHKEYIRNLSAQSFLKLVKDEALEVTLFHV
jgi:hypothetical protein